jgi:hypothetical protein
MHGKRTISIVIFLNCIQVVSRMKQVTRQPPRILPCTGEHWRQNHPRCQASRQKTIKNSEGLPFHAFSWIKPGWKGTCNNDSYLSIYAKLYLRILSIMSWRTYPNTITGPPHICCCAPVHTNQCWELLFRLCPSLFGGTPATINLANVVPNNLAVAAILNLPLPVSLHWLLN